MSANMGITEPLWSVVSLLWEIKDFTLFMNLHENELESPPFQVKFTEVVSFFLTLRPRDDIVDCFLYRLDRVDILGDLYVQCRIFVVGTDKSMYFSKMCSIKVHKETRSVKLFDFLDTKLLREEHLPNGTLRLQLNFGVAIAKYETVAWNNNKSLTALSRDILELYDKDKFSNSLLLIAAPCPKLDALDETISEDEIASTYNPQTSKKILLKDNSGALQLTTLLTLPPKSSSVKRSNRLYLNTDENLSIVHKTMNWLECEEFLRYLYSGRLHTEQQDDEMRYRLLLIARDYNLTDLIHRLIEVPVKSTFITKMVVDALTLDFDLGFVKGKENYFDPMTHLVNLSNTEKLYLSVTFSAVKDIDNDNNLLHINCQFIECALPTTIKTEILVFDDELGNRPVATTNILTTVCDHQNSWSPPINVEIKSSVYVKCNFSVCRQDKAKITRQYFSLSSADVIVPKTLRQLSYDFATDFSKERNNFADMTLVTQPEEKLFHKQFLCARFPGFRHYLSSRADISLQPKTLENLITYAYTGMLLEKDPTNVKKLLITAYSLHLLELVKACETFLGVGFKTKS